MKRVLILCSHYCDDVDANGYCVRNIVGELLNRGIEVYIIAETFQEENILVEKQVKIYNVKSALFGRLNYTVQKNKNILTNIVFACARVIHSIKSVLFFPNVSYARSRKVYKLAKELIIANNIDFVFGTYRPYESIYATVQLKKFFGEKICAVTYHLDLMGVPNNRSKVISEYKKIKQKGYNKREFCCCDGMILPKHSYSGDTSKKIKNIDFPLYIKTNEERRTEYYDKELINITYVGSLDVKNRNPAFILKVLDEINKISNVEIRINIWGPIDNEIREIIKRSKAAKYWGIAESEEVIGIMNESNVILNIGNKVTYEMIPSKIFQIFASGKPVISVVNDLRDKSLRYFELISDVFFVYDNQSCDIEKLLQFICKKRDGRVAENRKEIFYESSPLFAVNTMESLEKQYLQKKGSYN